MFFATISTASNTQTFLRMNGFDDDSDNIMLNGAILSPTIGYYVGYIKYPSNPSGSGTLSFS
jgi:hypothetical protein